MALIYDQTIRPKSIHFKYDTIFFINVQNPTVDFPFNNSICFNYSSLNRLNQSVTPLVINFCRCESVDWQFINNQPYQYKDRIPSCHTKHNLLCLFLFVDVRWHFRRIWYRNHGYKLKINYNLQLGEKCNCKLLPLFFNQLERNWAAQLQIRF